MRAQVICTSAASAAPAGARLSAARRAPAARLTARRSVVVASGGVAVTFQVEKQVMGQHALHDIWMQGIAGLPARCWLLLLLLPIAAAAAAAAHRCRAAATHSSCRQRM